MIEIKVAPFRLQEHKEKWFEADDWLATVLAKSFRGQLPLDFYVNGRRYITDNGYVYPTSILFDDAEDAVYFKLKYPELLDLDCKIF